MTGLGQNQVQQYLDDGFLFPLRAMGAEKAAQYRARLEALESKYQNKNPGRSFRQYIRVNSHIVVPMSYELARTPAIIDAVASIIGPNILLWGVEYFIKEANSEKIVSWHQDMTYWGLGLHYRLQPFNPAA